MSSVKSRLPILVLAAGAMIIGFSPILVRLSQAGPSATGFWRLAFAAPFILAFSGRRPQRPDGSGGRLCLGLTLYTVLAGVAFAGDLIFWHYSIHLTSVTNATVLSNGTPILVTLSGWIFLKERPRRIFLAGMILAVLGAVVMGLAKTASPDPGGSPRLGDAFAAFTAVWYAAYFLAIREARRTMDAPTAVFWAGVIGLPITLGAAFIMGERILPAALAGWAACVCLGLVHAAGQGSIAWALGRVPAALASVVVLVQPVVAALLGWAAFGEAVAPLQALGAAVALAGVAIAQRSGVAKGSGGEAP